MIFIACKEKDKLFQKIKILGNVNYKFMKNFCNLSDYKDMKNILVLYNLKIDNKGIIKEYNYVLEEIFITLPIELLITNKCNAKLKEICSYYKIPILKL